MQTENGLWTILPCAEHWYVFFMIVTKVSKPIFYDQNSSMQWNIDYYFWFKLEIKFWNVSLFEAQLTAVAPACLKMGQSQPLFVYFHSFHIRIQLTNIQFELYKLKKSIDGVLGTRIRGGWMEGIDKSTELWRRPCLHHNLIMSPATIEIVVYTHRESMLYGASRLNKTGFIYSRFNISWIRKTVFEKKIFCLLLSCRSLA